MKDNRDYREETNLNATEEVSLTWAAGKLGLTKAAVLRMALILLVEKIRRDDLLAATGLVSGD